MYGTPNSCTLLNLACAYGREQMVNFLLSQGDDPNQEDLHGATALHRAIDANHPACVIELLKHVADINRKDAYGVSPLFQAVQDNQIEMSALLLGYGADINAVIITTGSHLVMNIENQTPEVQANIMSFIAKQKDSHHIAISVRDVAMIIGNQALLKLLNLTLRQGCAALPQGYEKIRIVW
jgi:ankyrin repeat protein